MKRLVLWSLAVSLFVGGIVSHYASSLPDGLERSDEKLVGTELNDSGQVVPAPMPDYTVPGIRNARVSGGVAGIAGVIITFGLCLLLGKLVERRKREPTDNAK